MSEASKPTEPVEIFYAYSHKDEHLRDKLEKHLSILKRQGVVTGWHDRKISPGEEWGGEIDMRLNTARIILLLISPDFLASDYCWDVEVERAMERHEAGEARVIPVILRPVVWKGALFGKLQALPKDGKPVTSWTNRDKAFVDIATGIQAAVEKVVSTRPHVHKTTLPSQEETGIEELDLKAPDIELASEYEKDSLIRDLANSGSFRKTHSCIAGLQQYADFTQRQANDIVLASITNTQVYTIISDTDVKEFLLSVIRGREDQIEPIVLYSELWHNEPTSKASKSPCRGFLEASAKSLQS